MAGELDVLRSKFEGMSPEDRSKETLAAFERIRAAFDEMFGSEDEGHRQATLLVLYAAVADGRFDRSEFEIMKPMLSSMFQGEMDYDRAKSIIQNTMDDEDDAGGLKWVLEMKGRLLDHDAGLAETFGILMLGVCSIDGCISRDEMDWLGEILRIPCHRDVGPDRTPFRIIQILIKDHSARPSIIRRQLDNCDSSPWRSCYRRGIDKHSAHP